MRPERQILRTCRLTESDLVAEFNDLRELVLRARDEIRCLVGEYLQANEL